MHIDRTGDREGAEANEKRSKDFEVSALKLFLECRQSRPALLASICPPYRRQDHNCGSTYHGGANFIPTGRRTTEWCLKVSIAVAP